MVRRRVRRWLGVGITLVMGLVMGVALAGVPAAHAADRDCGDFATQKAAQIFFLQQGGPRRDPHRLDADGDGIACETNPCPCYYGKKLPGAGGGGSGGGSGGGGKPARLVQVGRVVRVVDGDTANVRLRTGRVRSVRLIGIDTPERGRCGFGPASRSLAKMAPRGTRVRLVSDPTQDLKDRYGRLLRYVVKAASKRDLNRAQVAKGWARVYVYRHNPFERVAPYRRAQKVAKAESLGIWGLCR